MRPCNLSLKTCELLLELLCLGVLVCEKLFVLLLKSGHLFPVKFLCFFHSRPSLFAIFAVLWLQLLQLTSPCSFPFRVMIVNHLLDALSMLKIHTVQLFLVRTLLLRNILLKFTVRLIGLIKRVLKLPRGLRPRQSCIIDPFCKAITILSDLRDLRLRGVAISHNLLDLLLVSFDILQRTFELLLRRSLPRSIALKDHLHDLEAPSFLVQACCDSPANPAISLRVTSIRLLLSLSVASSSPDDCTTLSLLENSSFSLRSASSDACVVSCCERRSCSSTFAASNESRTSFNLWSSALILFSASCKEFLISSFCDRACSKSWSLSTLPSASSSHSSLCCFTCPSSSRRFSRSSSRSSGTSISGSLSDSVSGSTATLSAARAASFL
ncbi:hypothetical protein KC316_g47 [Hortaea werneckii]|nr:hypothetical protein KC316_g47 [Hortaea werneckii]